MEVLDSSGLTLTSGTLVIPGEISETTTVTFDPVIHLAPDVPARVRLTLEGSPAVAMDGNLELHYQAGGAEVNQVLGLEQEEVAIAPGHEFLGTIEGAQGTLQAVNLGASRWLDPASGRVQLTASLLDDPTAPVPLAVASGEWVPRPLKRLRWTDVSRLGGARPHPQVLAADRGQRKPDRRPRYAHHQ
jgi:hypothetical protein